MWAAGVALAAVVVVLSWATARRRPDHRYVAAVLTLGLACDLARKAILVYVLRPARVVSGDAPFVGVTRAACDIDNALMLAYPAAIAALASWVFLRRRPWAIAAVYLLAVAALAVAYPLSRGVVLARVYMGVELAAVSVTLGAFVMWFWRRETPWVHEVDTCPDRTDMGANCIDTLGHVLSSARRHTTAHPTLDRARETRDTATTVCGCSFRAASARPARSGDCRACWPWPVCARVLTWLLPSLLGRGRQ